MEIDAKVIKQMSMLGQAPSIFGLCLPRLIASHPEIIVLTADQAFPAGLDGFKTKFPDNFLSVGIAEQNMIGVSAGLAEAGRKPICVAQACFLSMRAFEQVRQYCGYMKLPLILIGLSSGFGLTMNGNTHYALEDIALMRTIPGMSIACPASERKAVEDFEEALIHDGPVYIRLNGMKETQLPGEYDSNILAEGADLNIIACGSMSVQALKAAEILKEKGLQARVFDCNTIVPMSNEALVEAAPLTVTVEEHRAAGGLGEAIASEMINRGGGNLLRICVGNDNPAPASYPDLLEQCGLTPIQISDTILERISAIGNN